MRFAAVLIALVLMALPLKLSAQESATLVADSVQLNGNQSVTATGNVELFYQGTRLRASSVVYDRKTDRLTIVGPIVLDNGGSIVLLAESAELDRDFRNGIMRSARLVLDQQLQLAAAEINRVGGRYMQLNKTVASSCKICGKNPIPLWEIRSKRVVHDTLERQLYFENAQLRIVGVPVFYLPRLRLPDPTLDRTNGFLVPEYKSSSQLGTGFRIPYFLKFGDKKDLTLTPLIAAKTRTLEYGYRQAFSLGRVEFDGAVSDDTLLPGETRAYLFGTGRFNLAEDFRLNFDIQATSDDDYLREYDYSSQDRLRSNLALLRTRREENIAAEFVLFQSLRDSEDKLTIPSQVGNISYTRRFFPAAIGGELGVNIEAHSQYRRSNTDGIDGRDVKRATARMDWRRNWTTPNGVQFSALGNINVDYYRVLQDSSYESDITQFTPQGAVELRWPLVKNTGGVSYVIEPVMQLVWTKRNGADVPNEDSTLVELDEGNLFSLSRFPGADAYERGLRANVGVSWTRYDPAGWNVGVTLGRVFRAEDLGQFSLGSGLTGRDSDWLLATRATLPQNISLTNRTLFGNDLPVTKSETRLLWFSEKFELASSYIWMVPAPAENRPDKTSEWTFETAYNFRHMWTARADWRYDFIAKRAARTGIGLEYGNECIRVDLSLSRRYTSSTSVAPTTEFGFSVALNGFGTGGSSKDFKRNCSDAI